MTEKRRLQLNPKWVELISYGIFGVATTVVNIAIYQIFLNFVDYKISNLIAIIGAKVFAYIVNKKFVFHSKCANYRDFICELVRFIFARGFTGLVDYFGLILLVEVFTLNETYSKYMIQVIVIILNYIFGKKMVFTSSQKKFKHNVGADQK